MAKELPYFKFEPNQWENGNIQMLSREDKGLFVDLCSMYWSRLGDVPIKLAIQKLCAGNTTAFNSLCDERIIEVLDGNIFIKFLSEQLGEFEDISKQNSKNAKDRWEKYRKQKAECERNANASIPQCENDAIREDKSKEDKSKEDINTATPFSFLNSLIKDGAENQLVLDWLKVRKNKKLTNTKTAYEAFIKEVKKSKKTVNQILTQCVENSWGGFKSEWSSSTTPTAKTNSLYTSNGTVRGVL